VRAIDGDSFVVMLADGERHEVRLIGVNAPESDECHGNEARGALAEWLSDEPLRLDAGAGADRDGFGRLLRFASTEEGDAATALIAGGHATTLQSEHPRNAEYASLTDAAWSERRGMWAIDACGPATGATVDIPRWDVDPPGDDTGSDADEWVAIRNTGSTAVALAGWTLRDESSQHRYRFGDLRLDPDEEMVIHSRCGDDGGPDLYWCAGAVWNNGGDTVIVQDASGNVVARRRYGSDVPGGRDG
jgi:micrococcal nuclease